MSTENGRVALLLEMLDDAYSGSDEHSLCCALYRITPAELHFLPAGCEPGGGGMKVWTIVHRGVHVAACKVMYANHAFGDRALTWEAAGEQLRITSEAELAPEGVRAALDVGHQRLRDALVKLTDADLDAMVFTNWGEQVPARRIFQVMIQHDIWHGGQIRTMRALYQAARG